MRDLALGSLLGIVVVAVGGGVLVRTMIEQKKSTLMTRADKTRQLDNVIHLVSLLGWPALYFAICASTGLTVPKDPYILLGLGWPVFLLAAKMVTIEHDRKEEAQESHVRHGEARGSAGLLFTAAFGVGVILTALRKDTDMLGSKLVLLSLLICVAFLIPSATHPVTSHTAHSVRTLQTCVTQMAIGIFILGITVSYFRSSPSST